MADPRQPPPGHEGRSQQGEEAEGHEEDSAEAASRSAVASCLALAAEERECRICYNPFDAEARAPKLLACLHTFCLDCLVQMHRHQTQSGGGGGGAGRGAAAERGGPGDAITCALCRHRTALPKGHVHDLPLNTKLIPPPPPPPPPPDRLQLLPLSWAPRPTFQRPLPEQGGNGALSPEAAEASGGCNETGWSRRQEMRTVRCVCIVFTFFSMMVVSITGPLFLNYSGWVELFMVSLFLVVAIVLALLSVMPYLLHSRGYRTVAAALLAGEGASVPRGAALGRMPISSHS
ncbi:E3 ubiquitin-protein ligase RNF186 [Pantherophis guttatus]|uniref:E3 ubiquitin-protein ligase RNF186 n=1 Tax=Pantherophis guttatus TaxID=94885 RepID=A0A6P9DW62_PANGU|nr:E3 ubiquitin-protein ligase RNF186 [Pantherophis guttatus]